MGPSVWARSPTQQGDGGQWKESLTERGYPRRQLFWSARGGPQVTFVLLVSQWILHFWVCRPFFFFFFSPHSDVRKEGDAQVHASFTSIYHQVRLILQPSAPFSTRMLLLERNPGDMFCVYAPTVWWAWTRLGWKIHQHLFSLSLSGETSVSFMCVYVCYRRRLARHSCVQVVQTKPLRPKPSFFSPQLSRLEHFRRLLLFF